MKASYSEEEFHRVRAFLESKAGLVFDDGRRDSLAYSLGERLEATSCGSVDAYLVALQTPGPAAALELQALLNEVTIQETHFFRNPPQFRALRQHVLPQLVKAASLTTKTLRVWSAGCSTGEEPYSVAMIIRELLPITIGWDVQVIATDISTRALEAAKEARYSGRALAVTDPDDLERFFVPDGDGYVVKPEVRELVTFRHHNLVADPPPFGNGEAIDLILCRNVTIYFSRDTTKALMGRFHASLRDGGYLFLGHSETLWQVTDRFHLVTLGEAFVYKREDGQSGRAERRADVSLDEPDRRVVLPDRRTRDEGPPDGVDRRKGDRRSSVWDALTKPRALPFVHPPREPEPVVAAVTPDQAIDAVRLALREGRYQAAADLARDAAELIPMQATPHYLRGLALVNLGRDSEALVELRKAVYVDPGAGLAHFLLASALSRLGDGAASARAYRAAAESLGNHTSEELAEELGGRSVQELVELCWQLSGATPQGR